MFGHKLATMAAPRRVPNSFWTFGIKRSCEVPFAGHLITEKGVSVIVEASRSEGVGSGASLLLADDDSLALVIETAQAPGLKWFGRLGESCGLGSISWLINPAFSRGPRDSPPCS